MATCDQSHECNPWVADQTGSTGSRNTTQVRLTNITSSDNPECGSDDYRSHSDTSNDESTSENKQTQQRVHDSLPIFRTPHRLINLELDGNVRVNKDVLGQIAQIDTKLNIVAITGPYRTGKSYLLNRLAGAKKGFEVMSTVESVTKGIWVWCRPHPKYQNQVLLLLDTEGLGDIEKDGGEFDHRILILVLLLCSTFIYNFAGALARSVLEELRYVTEISKRIKLSDEISDEDCGDIDIYFPHFILVLRDLNLDMKDADEFFEETVLSRKGDSKGEMNETRCRIRKQFKNRKCFAFVSPGGRKILRKLQDVEDATIDELFIEQLKQFTQFVYDKCPPKQINNGQIIDGKTFAILTKTYVKEVRGGNVPKIKTVLNTVSQTVNKQAIEKCMELYHSQMISILQFPTSEKILFGAHQICSKDAISLFLRACIYEQDGEFLQLANASILSAYEDYKRQDEDASIQKSEMTLKELGAEIGTRMANKFYFRSGGYSSYCKDLKELKNKYKEMHGLGCKKEETLSKYLSKTDEYEENVLKIDTALTLEEQEDKVERLQKEAQRRQLRCIELSRNEQITILAAEREFWKSLIEHQQVTNKIEMEKQATHLSQILEKRQEEEKRLQNEGFIAEAAKLTEQINDLQKRLDDFNCLSSFALIGRGFKKIFKRAKKKT